LPLGKGDVVLSAASSQEESQEENGYRKILFHHCLHHPSV
jgi:hypothetical protein